MSVNKSDETKQMKNLGINDGCKLEVKDIELVETFKCTGQELYNALTQKEMIQVFTGGEVKVKYNTKLQNFLLNFQLIPHYSLDVLLFYIWFI